MAVSVMDIRVMRVAVRHRLVLMRMAVRLGAIPGEIMLMLVMRVMRMLMVMLHGLMGMVMLVPFG